MSLDIKFCRALFGYVKISLVDSTILTSFLYCLKICPRKAPYLKLETYALAIKISKPTSVAFEKPFHNTKLISCDRIKYSKKHFKK